MLARGLRFHPPLDADTLLSWFAARAIAGLEYVDGGCYRRTLRLPHGSGAVELEAAGPSLIELRATLTHHKDIESTVRRCRDLLDLDSDPQAIDGALAEDPAMARLVARRPGMRVPGSPDGFELAIRAVVGQQISVVAATTFVGRLVRSWGEPMTTSDERLTHLFPTPSALVDAPLESIGLNARQAGTVRSLARVVATGDISLDTTADRQETRERLLAVPGIGDWTASYIAMRALRDADAFPAGDLGLRRAAGRLGLPGTTSGLRDHALRWRPWRAYAAMHLWANLADPATDAAMP